MLCLPSQESVVEAQVEKGRVLHLLPTDTAK